tara:strand:- start:72 stop:1712 length:1641 start_codon:yes stop_codon:yes gene_type:complete
MIDKKNNKEVDVKNNVIKLANVKKIMKEMECPLKDYLIKPFNNLVDDLIVNKKYGVCNIGVGITGQGKTYAITQNGIEKLFNDAKVKLIIYSAPDSAVLENDKFEDAADNIDNCKMVTKANKAIKELKKGKNVIYCTTHAGVWTKSSKYGKKLIQYILQNLKDQVAIFIDEAHTWTVSDAINYLETTGNRPVKYEATLFKSVSKISQISPYIFGITATPNREAKGLIDTVGNMKYKIYNEMPPKDLMINKNSWLNKVNLFDVTNKTSIEKMILQMLQDMKKDIETTGFKKTAIIQCKPNLSEAQIEERLDKGQDTWNANIDEIAAIICELNNKYNIFDKDKLLYAIMNQSKKNGYSTLGDKETYDDEDEIKEDLDDTDSSLKILLVVEKGKAGMNVFSLGYMMSLKEFNSKGYKADEYGYITETPLQILGRCVRLWTGQNNDKFVKENGEYDIVKYLKNNKNKLDIIKILNSFNVYVSNNQIWEAAIEQFKDSYITCLDDINFDELLSSKTEEEFCPQCGASSKYWNKKLVKDIDNDFSGIDEVLN